MKSALTAALSGKLPDSVRAPPAAQEKEDASDTKSFPCLQDATSTEPASFQPGSSLTSAVGSIPTASLLPDGSAAADYELNPHRRRGGQERVPTPRLSLGDKSRWDSLGSASLKSNFMADAVIGSLPRGLSVDERRSIAQSTPLSPSLNMLSAMPSEKIGSRSIDATKLRRHLLRGAVVVFVTAGYSGKRFIFEKVKELGVRSVILDGPDSWSQTLFTEGVIDKFIGIDFAEADAVFERCCAAMQSVQKHFGELDGILTFCEMAVPLVARLAEHFGLPGNTPQSVDDARDKHATRRVMQEAALPTPRNYLISDASHIGKAAEVVGFPAVIKPIFGAASIGVVRVDGREQLEEVYLRVQKQMASVRIDAGAISEGHQGDQGNASSWIKTTLMLEEYLDGPEVDVDLVIAEGRAVYGAITDNWPTVEPYFNETGSNCPSILPRGQQRQLIRLAVQSVQCLGLSLGVFHVELKFTSRGPRLIEVNCRMGGGPVRDTNLRVWGIDLVEEHLLTSLRIPTKPLASPVPLANLAEYSLNAKKSGRMQHTNFMQEWAQHPDVLYAHALVKAGQQVTGPQDGMPTWVAEVMVSKPTVQEAISFITAIEEAIVVPIQ